MTKKSRKSLALYEKDQSGCIKSLINNVFAFRQSRSSQKLLQDKKHESKRITGAAYPHIKLDSLRESCETCKELGEAVQTETSTIDAYKISMKELMYEEMIGTKEKNRRRTKSTTCLNLQASDIKAEVSVSKNPIHRRHKSLSSICLNSMVEELCSQINHKDGEELVCQVIEDPSVVEDKLWEATRVLISQFSDGKSIIKDGKVQGSKEFVGALRIIDSNKDVFVRLLQDPNSQLVKNIQTIQDFQVGEGKQQRFFWRRFKAFERNPSKKNDSSEDLNRIVVLKPGPPVSGNSRHNRVVSSIFSFLEFKRKLRHVMRKEQNMAVETVAMASPCKDNFFIERFPKSPFGVKKVDTIAKPKDDVDNNTKILHDRRPSNIYIDVKEHLTEIIGGNGVDEDSTSRQASRSLATTNEPTSEVHNPLVEPISHWLLTGESNVDKPSHGIEVSSSQDIHVENKPMETTNVQVDSPSSSKCSRENCHPEISGQDSCSGSEPSSSSQIPSSLTCLVTEKSKDQEVMSDAASKPSPVSVLEPLFSEDDISSHSVKSLLSAIEPPVQPRQIRFEEEISAPSEQYAFHKPCIEDEKHSFDFVKAVVQLSGLTWDEVHRRTLFSDHLIDPSLLDEVDFLQDLLPYDFNVLFDLIIEVVIEISWVSFGYMIPFVKPSVHPSLRDKDIFTKIWKGVYWYLKLEEECARNMDQLVLQDLTKSGFWMNTRPDGETIGIQLQEAIIEELVEDTILSCFLLV